MKLRGRLRLILIIIVLSGYSSETMTDSDWNYSLLNTAKSANFLSPLEKDIILEINKLRSNPSKYANSYIAPLANHYNKKLLYYPGDKPLLTREGVSALHECVRDLRNQQALSVLFPDEGLSKAAQDHVKDQSGTGRTGHIGSDRSGFRDRIERYGEWKKQIAENIAYGGSSARQIVIYLLIDDGIRSRGHRKNFLNPDFRIIGIATGSHPSYEIMSVMDFAAGYETKSN